MNIVQGLQHYYQKDKWKGVAFFIKARFYQRIVKRLKFANWHYFIDPYRVITKRYEETIPLIDEQFQICGNYAVSKLSPLHENSIVYSLGVLSETSFDQAVANRYGCKVYLFDPSIIATRHIKKISHPNFVFEQIGIWNENTEFTFSTPVYGGSPSMIFEHPGRQFIATCRTLPDVMAQFSHSHIDVLKLDVEGAAPTILEHALDSDILPQQVIVEFERKRSSAVTDLLQFFNEIDRLRARFRTLGYTEHRLPREKYSYYSLELIFVKLQ